LHRVDGQVCNGGFQQFYENTGGAQICLAIAGYRMLNRHDLAAIVVESLAYAKTLPELRTDLPDCENPIPKTLLPRNLDQLDAAYYMLIGAEEFLWLDAAIINLILTRPEFF
jgi:hypothetical protein